MIFCLCAGYVKFSYTVEWLNKEWSGYIVFLMLSNNYPCMASSFTFGFVKAEFKRKIPLERYSIQELFIKYQV